MVLQDGEIVGPYRITSQLGQGGMVTVYTLSDEPKVATDPVSYLLQIRVDELLQSP